MLMTWRIWHSVGERSSGSPPGAMDVSILTTASGWGGAELQTVALARGLVARGHRVTIAELGHEMYSLRIGGYPDSPRIVALRRRRKHGDIGHFEAVRLVRQLPRGVCVFPKIEFDAGNWQLDLAARRWFRRYVTIEHTTCPPMPLPATARHFGGLLPGVGLWWYQLLASRVARSLGPHLVLTVSEAIRKGLLSHYRFPARKVVTVHNGVDLSRFRPDAERRRSVRASWGIPDNALVFGSVGRLHHLKGHALSVKLFAQLAHSMPERDLWLVLVGDGPAAGDLAASVQAAGLERRILLKGFSEKPWEAHAALDVFLLPSAFEGLSLALIEAMACGCCPIATAVGGIPEVVRDAAVGWLVPFGDADAFLAAMTAAAQASPATRAEMGHRARQHVMTSFNAGAQLSRLVNLVVGDPAVAAGDTRADDRRE